MEGGEFREDFLEEEVSGLNFERRVSGSQTKEIGKGTAVRKQPEQRLGGDVALCVLREGDWKQVIITKA